MDEFLEQIETAIEANQFYLALFCCLTLPDICGAISSSNGEANGNLYKKWFDRYVSPKYDGNFTGSSCYAFRCAALHQGRAEHKNLGYKKIVFVDPSTAHGSILHNNVLDDVLNIDTREFCMDIIQGVRQWITESTGDTNFKKNYETLLKRHKGGLEAYITGVDVFC